MRIIITGGTGLTGRAPAESLTADGYEVIALSRNPAQAQGLPAGVKAERWDGRTAHGWGWPADGAAAIINLAGESIAAPVAQTGKRAGPICSPSPANAIWRSAVE